MNDMKIGYNRHLIAAALENNSYKPNIATLEAIISLNSGMSLIMSLSLN
jgi:hypothetical protein